MSIFEISIKIGENNFASTFNTLRYFYCTGVPMWGFVKLWRGDDRFLNRKEYGA